MAFFIADGGAVRFRLQLILDKYRPVTELDTLLDAGVDCVQVRIRDENDSTVRLLDYVHEVVERCRAFEATVLVNGRLDIAMAAGAHGVQVSKSGLRPKEVRSVAPGLFIASSVHSVGDAIDAAEEGADVVTFGHVFESGSHPGIPGRGLNHLRAVVDAVELPVVAIGGIGPGNVAVVKSAGAAAVAVIGSIWNVDACERNAVARVLRKEMER
jgi:thiamine-phosphate pyrophosphorylase